MDNKFSKETCAAIGGSCDGICIDGWEYCHRHLQQPHIGDEYEVLEDAYTEAVEHGTDEESQKWTAITEAEVWRAEHAKAHGDWLETRKKCATAEDEISSLRSQNDTLKALNARLQRESNERLLLVDALRDAEAGHSADCDVDANTSDKSGCNCDWIERRTELCK
jgi:hypothetical protein